MDCESIRLANGQLEFTALSCGSGPLVVFIHGFPDLPDTWKLQLRACAAAGFRAVAVTSRGYESSSQPDDGNYQLTALASDVLAWMDSLGVEKAHLVGHDWGAAIAYAAAATRPDRFSSLCAMAVPHSGRFASAMLSSKRQLWLSRYIIFFQLKGIAEWHLRRRQFVFVDKLWRRWSPGWSYDSSHTHRIRKRFAVPGVLDAALAYYRQGTDAKSDTGVVSRQIANHPVAVPTLALHGDRDCCIDPKVFKDSMHDDDFPSGLVVETIANAGHFLHLEAPDVVNKRLIFWLQGSHDER